MSCLCLPLHLFVCLCLPAANLSVHGILSASGTAATSSVQCTIALTTMAVVALHPAVAVAPAAADAADGIVEGRFAIPRAPQAQVDSKESDLLWQA